MQNYNVFDLFFFQILSRYSGDSYREYDYDLLDTNFSKQGKKDYFKKRHLRDEGFDITSPSTYYGTGYGHANGIGRQGAFGGVGVGGIDPQVTNTNLVINWKIRSAHIIKHDCFIPYTKSQCSFWLAQHFLVQLEQLAP